MFPFPGRSPSELPFIFLAPQTSVSFFDYNLSFRPCCRRNWRLFLVMHLVLCVKRYFSNYFVFVEVQAAYTNRTLGSQETPIVFTKLWLHTRILLRPNFYNQSLNFSLCNKNHFRTLCMAKISVQSAFISNHTFVLPEWCWHLNFWWCLHYDTF